MNYYNEWDKGAAAWLRELIRAGHIPPGDVDERSITEVTASDLAGYSQCHFFAGIGGWSLALRIAGVPDTFKCWTGSPPCQPFSVAGKQLGQLDERHLAPTFMRLIAQCRPPVLFGEQVAAAIGKHWLDDLFTELEAESYACGAAVLPAASVGAPHRRDRLFFGAVGNAAHISEYWRGDNGTRRRNEYPDNGAANNMAHTNDARPQGWAGMPERGIKLPAGPCGMADSVEQSGGQRRERREETSPGNQHDRETPIGAQGEYGAGEPGAHRVPEDAASTHHGFWSDADWLGCRDGKFRPVEPGTFPLAHGIPARVGRLRGYGNAIVPQVAAEFIKAFRGACEDQ